MPIHLEPGPDNVHWGYFDARLAPRATVDSGDRLTISTVSGGPDLMPAAPLKVPPALPAIHQKVPRQLGPHILTGPVAVRGARPGQVLQVDIEAIDVFYDWGYNSVRPLAGALPDDFAENRHMHIVLDRARKCWRLPWGQEVPLAPFFGVMGTAPPPAWGMISTAAQERRQSRQQGTRRRQHALSADLRSRRAVLGRRRTRRTRRRRGLRHSGGDRIDRHLPPHAARRHAARVAAS
jgi:acetamidase/formamidase